MENFVANITKNIYFKLHRVKINEAELNFVGMSFYFIDTNTEKGEIAYFSK